MRKPIDPREIEILLEKTRKGYLTLSQLAKFFGTSRRRVKKAVNVLMREGKVVKFNRGYALLEQVGKKLQGRIEIKRGGFGFVITDEGDVFVPSYAIGGAEDGDIVEVVVFPRKKSWGNLEGRVLKVIKRKRNFYVGVYLGEGRVKVLGSSQGEVTAKMKKVKPKYGDPVLIKRTGKHWRIVEVKPDDYDIVIKTFNLDDKFPPEVLRESETLKSNEGERVDLRGEFTITIDPRTAKDYDDAIYVERYDKGWILKVHIADVSFWVGKDGYIDGEAFKRGNSVYLIERVIPMLPPRISDDLASLLPGKPRLAFTVEVKITRNGRILFNTARFYKSKILSWARLTYEDAQRILDGFNPEDPQTVIHREALGGVRRALKEASNLAEVLRGKRSLRGSIDFDLPEAEFFMENGKVLMVQPKERLWTHRIIEELMITANAVVATYFHRKRIPTLYRIHANPKEKKVKEFIKLAEKILGKSFKHRKITPKFLNGIVKEFEGRPEENLMNYLLLRSMARAEYSPKNIGHFGLALKNYLHFTSPIRRYADLVVHRQLWASITGNPPPYTHQELEKIGKHLSETERLAEEAEWEIWKLKIYEFMESRVGDRFEGIITGISSESIFVQITQHLAEGYIPLNTIKGRILTLPRDYTVIVFDRRKTRKISLGDKVLVEVISVDKYSKDMVLRFVDTINGPHK